MKKICTTLCLLSFTTLFAIAPNQMGDDSNDGIQQSNLKLSLGWSQENHTAYRAHLLQGTFEFMMGDRFGLRGTAGIPLSKNISSMEYYPMTLGGAFHLFPRFWFDLYMGAESGFVHFSTNTLSASWSTRITPFVGTTLYYWGVFFLEGEAGYSVWQYAKSAALDLSAPTYRVRLGFYL